MEKFGTLLKKYIKEQNYTVYQLAKECNINRSFLQGIISGKKDMPEKRLNSVVNDIVFSEKQAKELIECYYEEKYSPERVRNFHTIEKGLKGEYLSELNKKSLYAKSVDLITNHSYTTQSDVMAVIYSVISKNTTRFFTNFSFAKQKEISKIVYNRIKEKKVENYFHCINEYDLDNDDRIYSVFCIAHFAEIGYITHILKDSVNSGALLPYFILTDDYFIQFDENAQCAVLLDAKIINPLYDFKAFEIKSHCLQIVEIVSNAVDNLEKTGSLSISDVSKNSGSVFYGFDSSVCPIFITKEIVEAIAMPAAKQTPGIGEYLVGHYANINDNVEKINLIIRYEAVEDFVNTGRIYQFPSGLSTCVPLPMRAAVLEPFFKNDMFEVTLTNKGTFKSDRYYFFSYEIRENRLTALSCDNPNREGAFQGEVLIDFNDRKMAEIFRDFHGYFSHTMNTMSFADTKNSLELFVSRLKDAQ